MSEASGVPSWARVGAKVVCVDGARNPAVRPSLHPNGYPMPGKIYTIRAVVGPGTDVAESVVGILLQEIVSGINSRFLVEQPFRIGRFRPAVEPKSEAEDVALFRHHLTKCHPVDA